MPCASAATRCGPDRGDDLGRVVAGVHPDDDLPGAAAVPGRADGFFHQAGRAAGGPGAAPAQPDRGFTRRAQNLANSDSRVELIDGRQLVVMLNEYLGWTWPARIEHYTRQGTFKAIKR